MDERRIAAVTPLLTGVPSRRDLLRGLAGAGLGLSVTRLADSAEAKRQRKRKNRKPTPNAFGRLNVGDACRSAGQCCSGICQGRKGKKKRCRAHDTGGCKPGRGPGETHCTSNSGSAEHCYTTTAERAIAAGAIAIPVRKTPIAVRSAGRAPPVCCQIANSGHRAWVPMWRSAHCREQHGSPAPQKHGLARRP